MNRKNHEEIQKWLKSVMEHGAIQNTGRGAGRPCILVLMQAFVQEVGLALLELVRGARSTRHFSSLTLKWHRCHHMLSVAVFLPQAQ